jgi:hypothetical protein
MINTLKSGLDRLLTDDFDFPLLSIWGPLTGQSFLILVGYDE